MKSKYFKQAFEIEDIGRRENFMFVYDPYDEKVEMYDTSRGVKGGKQIKSFFKTDFPFNCETAYDYFVHMYNKSITFEKDNDFYFLGWVDPETVYPLAEKEYKGVLVDNDTEIKNKLNTKHNELLRLINDDEIRKIINEKGFISGGAIANLIADEEINDYDYHFTDKESLDKIYDYFDSQVGVVIHHKDGVKGAKAYKSYRGNTVIITDNAITLNEFQFILKDYGEPEDVVSKFDFVHCMGYYIPKDNELVVEYDTYVHCKAKSLRFNKMSDTPVTSFYRYVKFVERGWKSFRNEESKLLMKLASKKFTDDEIDAFEEASYY